MGVMYNDKKLDFRIQNAVAIDNLYFEKGDKTRSHRRVHELFIEKLLGITENTTQNYRNRSKEACGQKKPSAYITATLQVLGVFYTCAQIGLPMPKRGPLSCEDLAEYFSKSAIMEKEFNDRKNKIIKNKYL